jgi:uncharacterized protein involved in type VI secretion and phage assembly
MDAAAGPLPQAALELGEVVSVNDPEGLNRVQVRFLSRGPAAGDADNPDGGDSLAWALVATGFAGDGNGAFLIPDVGSRVVTSFLNGDPRYPVVLGAVWDGTTASPETLGGSGEEVDRWSFTGKAGTRIAMVEENGSSKIEVETANGNKLVIDDQQGSVKITQGGNTLTMSSGGITGRHDGSQGARHRCRRRSPLLRRLIGNRTCPASATIRSCCRRRSK